MERILIVEDERLIRNALKERLDQEGFRLILAENGEEAVRHFDDTDLDLVILDQRLPDTDGLILLEQLKNDHPEIPVIMMTAYSTIEQAVEAMKQGAYDYLGKPFNMDEMVLTVRKALETRMLKRRVDRLVEQERQTHGMDQIVGESLAIRELISLLRRIAESDASTVLIQGESGTGKDLAARAIHLASARASKPFMNITCSAMPEALLEAELFGHEAGAFTDAKQQKRGLFELANNGTVFLDEIGDMPPVLQAKLLRVLEDKSFRRVGGTEDIRVDVRIVAATNVDLQDAVNQGTFRTDLYYRLNVVPVHIPPLRNLRGDIPLLASHFLERFNGEFKRQVKGFTPQAINWLKANDWPGNVRELRNLIERAMILSQGEWLDLDDIVPTSIESMIQAGDSGSLFVLPADGIGLEAVEADLVRQALERTDNNRTQAGRLLGLTRDQVRYRIEKHKLEMPQEPAAANPE